MESKSIFPIDLSKIKINRKEMIYSGISILVFCCLVFGYSSKPPSDAIKNDIVSHNGFLQIKPELLKDYDITNSYTRKDGDETIYIYEYTVHYTTGDSDSGTLHLVKRGNSWYDVG